jgi:hypothetical protein
MKTEPPVPTAAKPATIESRDRSVTHEPELPHHMTEAEIDATLSDSFPASDPPSWTLGVSRDVSTGKRTDTSEKHIRIG